MSLKTVLLETISKIRHVPPEKSTMRENNMPAQAKFGDDKQVAFACYHHHHHHHHKIT
jgi:hypothetical protein